MNENLSFNDTFDDFTFTEDNKLSQAVVCNANIKLNNTYKRDLSPNLNNLSENISLDDTKFFDELITQSTYDDAKNDEYGTKTLQENPNVSDIKSENCVVKQFNLHNSRCGSESMLKENLSSVGGVLLKPECETIDAGNNVNYISNLHISTHSKNAMKCNVDTNLLTNGSTEQMETTKNNNDLPEYQDKMKENCMLSDWGLPAMILQKYESRGITNMFPWQIECLSNRNVLEQMKNLVYSAPTSAGKTLVAEILTIKTVLERNKKVLFILPFISVVREKVFYFQDILSTSGVRVEGFMGSYNPPGGFKTVQIAICTIEKANSLVNRLLEESSLSDIGAVIVDEMHLLGDSSRGYLLELLLTKLRYMSLKDNNVDIQIIGMSATLPNLELLAKWLDAELYTTSFRPIPLYEQYHVNGEIYNADLKLERKLQTLPDLQTDADNILQLCLETIQMSCSVLIFCPTKNWCENLAQQIATAFRKLGNSKSIFGEILRKELNSENICEFLEQLKRCPVGLDKILNKTVSFGVAFHHAGLTMDERDIIEGGFRLSTLRVLVATSTLSSGVNLPARRVIVRTPMFHGKPIHTLTYRQMIGRAGRMGKDVAGESLLICQKNDYKIAKELMSAKLDPIESCLEGAGKLKRAILEVIASGVASTPGDVKLFTSCTLLAVNDCDAIIIEEAISFLQNNEFIRLQVVEDGSLKYVPTSLAKACLSSSLPPEEGLALFTEIEKARQCFVLETDLHLIYLVTPYSACNQWNNIDWMLFLDMWEKLPASMKRVGGLVGVKESYMVSASRGKLQTNTNQAYHKLQIHKRFYTALALHELVNEVPLGSVAVKFNCSRGMLQSLQQSAATFAGMVTSFSKQLGWSSVEILISQFQDRLQFGINRELLDLMRLPLLNGLRARALYDGGIQSLIHLASSDPSTVENILYKVVPFASVKERDGETKYEAEKRNKVRTVWITGKQGVTELEAANMLIADARQYLQLEMGLAEAKWSTNDKTIDSSHHSSFIENDTSEKIVETHIDKFSQNEIDLKQEDNESKYVDLIEKQANSDLLNVSSDNTIKNVHGEFTQNMSNLFTQNNLNEGMDNKQLLCERNKTIAISESPSQIDNNFVNDLDVRLITSENIENKSASFNLNFSNESLFENSFNTENKENHEIHHTDTTKNEIFRDDAYLEKAFTSSFNIDSNTQPLNNINHKANTSNDFIANSESDTSACDTPLKSFSLIKFEHSDRKRCRSSDEFIIGSDTNDTLSIDGTPSKKKKLTRKLKNDKITKLSKFKKIDSTFIISQHKPDPSFVPFQSELASIDLTKIEIINVCDNRELFETFCKEVQQQNEISLSVACTKIEHKRRIIGANIIKSDHISNELKKFSYESRQMQGISITFGENTAYYISLNETNVHNKDKITILKTLFKNKNLTVKIFDSKEQVKVLKLCCDIDFNCNLEDPKVGSWLLEPDGKEKNLQALALKYSPEAVSLIQMAGNCKGVGSVGLDLFSSIEHRIRSSIEAVAAWHLASSIKNVIVELDMNLLHTYCIETNSMLVLAHMELGGIGVSLKHLQNLSDTILELCSAFEKKCYELAGRHFSLTSPTEVAKVLGMYKGKRVSTSKQVLEKNENPIANLIIQWRKLNSTLTNMIYPLLRVVRQHRIYGCCITHNSTGRISMHEPNLQNVPREFEVVNPINKQTVIINCRSVFVTSPKFLIISADYRQLELRLLAHFSKDSNLCSIMKTKEDVFLSVAAKLNSIEESEVSDQLRQRAKQICYGIIYGMGLKAISEQLVISEEEANEFLLAFHTKYPGIKKYIQDTINNCKKDGFVSTISGRRRYLPKINNQQNAVRSQAERQAVNTTIQGSAADITKNAMVLINNILQKKFYNSKSKPQLILQLHDELLYEVPVKHISLVGKIIKESMENSVKLSVPFPVKLKSGNSWGNLNEYNL